VIAETMPEDDPGTLSADEAQAVAAYIHDNMPYGIHYEEPVLSVQQAWDVAAYIISKPHPPAPSIAAPELQ
jgi:cytochrome c